jgi:uncharacterized protein (DUF305 family)
MSGFNIAAATLAAIILSAPLYAQDTADHTSINGHSMTSSPNAAKAPYDLQFLDTMTAHHQSALDMAKLADERSAHTELKQMAKTMIGNQQKEIQQLQDWKKQWYAGTDYAKNTQMPGMKESMGDMAMMDKLEAASGPKFDAMFLDLMPKHHAGAIRMAKDALKKAKHPEIKQFAQKVIDSQTDEVARMAKWKKEWTLAS